jgi:hypothetical protein
MQPPRKPPHRSGDNPDDHHELVKATPPAAPPSEDPLQKVIQRIIAGLSQTDKLIFLQALQKSGIERNDPYLEVLASHAAISQSLLELPGQLKHLVNELFRDKLAETDLYLQRVRETAIQETQRVIAQATKVQEAAISKSVSRLIATKRNQKAVESLSLLAWPLALTIIFLITIGMSTGWLLAHQQRSPLVTDKTIRLTQAQWEGLSFLESDEGKLARDIARWNQGQIVACQKKQVDLFKTSNIIFPGYGKPESGVCVVWVVPPESRTFTK